MKNKVYCAHDNYDGLITQGIADFYNQHCYFSHIFDSGPADDYTNIYELTVLPNDIFKLELQNWEYWLFWLNAHIQLGTNNNILHPVHYSEIRKKKEFDPKIFPTSLSVPKGHLNLSW